MNQNENNIRKYRKPLNINIGLIIFGIIFIYILFCVGLYMKTEPIKGYEVKMGTLSVDNIYEGIIVREETIVNSENDGYVNYYAQEGERVAVGNLIYSVDESGQLEALISSGELGETTLSSYDYVELKTTMMNFKQNFEQNSFNTVYDYKRTMSSEILKLSTQNILNNITQLTESGINNNSIQLCNSINTGIVTYNTDGYEMVTAENITMEHFNKDNYEKKQLLNSELVSKGDPIYKIADNEIWSVIVPMEAEQVQAMVEEDYVKVKFLKNQNTSWAKVSAIQNGDESFVKLDFNNSMISFSVDRFIDIEIILEEDKGLKVPNSSITNKEFFLIPIEFKMQESANESAGFLRETYLEDGTPTVEFITADIYYELDDFYYVDDSVLKIGDVIKNTDSLSTYTVSKKGSLIGVYNMDKGYADFKQVLVLYQNEEYSIVKSNTKYGLNVYDHIILDAESINDDEFIYD